MYVVILVNLPLSHIGTREPTESFANPRMEFNQRKHHKKANELSKMMSMKMKIATLFTVFLTIRSADAFFQFKPSAGAANKAKNSPLTDEAVGIFDAKYPFGREPPKPRPFANFGMPDRDLDGTTYKKYDPNSSEINRRFTDISETDARASFNELARLYGDEYALDMVKALPICLAFDKRQFSGCLKEWDAIFGEVDSKEMARRNPGLLAVRPDEAAKATDQTMYFSYIVAYTRPLGSVLLSLLLFLLLTPAIEYVTGIPIRSTFLP